MRTDFHQLFQGEWTLKNRIIFQKSIPFGVLNPTSVYGHNSKGEVFIGGPRGSFKIDKKKDIIVPLIASGSVLLGNSIKEMNGIAKLLDDENTSRTYSYLFNVAESPAEIIHFHKILSKTTVTFLGCGGIGSISAYLLCGAGIKNIRIVEFDKIEKSNLNRQIFFTKKDIGKYKADVISESLHQRFDDLNIEVIKNKISPQNVLKYIKKSDALFITADDPLGIEAKAQLIAQKFDIPVISCGYFGSDSMLFLNKKKKDLLQSEKISFSRMETSIMPSFGPTNSEVAGLASSLLIHAIIGKVDYKNENVGFLWNNNSFPRNIIQYQNN